MTKVQANLIRAALATNRIELACMLALCASIENQNRVYLPNAYALVKEHVSPKQWSGYLSALAKKGKYRGFDFEHTGFWGEVI